VPVRKSRGDVAPQLPRRSEEQNSHRALACMAPLSRFWKVRML
jgi:hypothetical protein